MSEQPAERRSSRTLIVGMDGASPDLMQQWASDGLLPTFARLMDEGFSAPLRSTVNFHSASAWTTFATGVGPATHGVYHFVNRVPGQYAAVAVHSGHIDSPTLWEHLTAQQVPLLALNVPMTYPVKAVSGIQVAGWLAPEIHSAGATYPAEVAGHITAKFGHYPMFPDGKRFVISGHLAEAVRLLRSSLETKLKVAEEYLASSDWQFAAVVFPETDAAQHWFWHFIDARSPQYSDDLVEQFGNPILETYAAVDRWLGRQLDRLGDDVELMIISDHGFTLQSRGELYVRDLLVRTGLLKPRAGAGRQMREVALRCIDKMPHVWRHRFARLAPEALSGGVLTKKAIGDNVWAATQAFASATWDPWINLAGREPQGIVAPDEYDQICDALRELLETSEDVATGRPAVAAVTRTRDEMDGKHIDKIPDLALQWTDEFAIGGLTARFQGKRVTATNAEGRRTTSSVTGAHSPYGILIALGDRLNERLAGAACPSAEPAMLDIAPTVIELLGLEVPSWIEGRSLLDSGSLAASSARDADVG